MYKQLHRITGILVSVFVIAHLFNHLMAWSGIEAHQETMSKLRMVYRTPWVEFILISAFLFQIVSGSIMVYRLKKRNKLRPYEKAQMWITPLLGLFLLNHMGATLSQRWIHDIETDFYFAAAVLHTEPLLYFFYPYYLIGVMAFGVHVALIHYEKSKSMSTLVRARLQSTFIIIVFFTMACVILYCFSGVHYSIVFPK